jgi:hypothetical protein
MPYFGVLVAVSFAIFTGLGRLGTALSEGCGHDGFSIQSYQAGELRRPLLNTARCSPFRPAFIVVSLCRL